MFGANKHEGIKVFFFFFFRLHFDDFAFLLTGLEVVSSLYRKYLVPNNLVEDEDFLKYDLVDTVLNALGNEDSYFFLYNIF